MPQFYVVCIHLGVVIPKIIFTQLHSALRVNYGYLEAEFKSVTIQSGAMCVEVMAGTMLMPG